LSFQSKDAEYQNEKYHDNNCLLDDFVNRQPLCPICKQKIAEHTELQDKICKMITIKQFANNWPGFDVQFRPFFED